MLDIGSSADNVFSIDFVCTMPWQSPRSRRRRSGGGSLRRRGSARKLPARPSAGSVSPSGSSSALAVPASSIDSVTDSTPPDSPSQPGAPPALNVEEIKCGQIAFPLVEASAVVLSDITAWPSLTRRASLASITLPGTPLTGPLSSSAQGVAQPSTATAVSGGSLKGNNRLRRLSDTQSSFDSAVQPSAASRPTHVPPKHLRDAKLLADQVNVGNVMATDSSESQERFAMQLINECAARVKKIMMVMMASSVHTAAGPTETGVGMENTLVAGFCDMMEKMWRHGCTSKTQSALWTFLSICQAQRREARQKEEAAALAAAAAAAAQAEAGDAASAVTGSSSAPMSRSASSGALLSLERSQSGSSTSKSGGATGNRPAGSEGHQGPGKHHTLPAQPTASHSRSNSHGQQGAEGQADGQRRRNATLPRVPSSNGASTAGAEQSKTAQGLSDEALEEVAAVDRMTFLHSDLGRGRAWIRLCLEKKCLSARLEQILQCEDVLRSMYRDYAFLRHPEYYVQLVNHLLSFTTVDFHAFSCNYPPAEVTYRMRINTGKGFRAGTSANVSVTVIGDHDSVGPLQRGRSSSFNAGGVHEFEFKVKNLGPIKAVELFHDGTGLSPNWTVESVTLVNTLTLRTYEFHYGQRVAREADGPYKVHLSVHVPSTHNGAGASGGSGAGNATGGHQEHRPSVEIPVAVQAEMDQLAEEFASSVNAIVQHFFAAGAGISQPHTEQPSSPTVKDGAQVESGTAADGESKSGGEASHAASNGNSAFTPEPSPRPGGSGDADTLPLHVKAWLLFGRHRIATQTEVDMLSELGVLTEGDESSLPPSHSGTRPGSFSSENMPMSPAQVRRMERWGRKRRDESEGGKRKRRRDKGKGGWVEERRTNC